MQRFSALEMAEQNERDRLETQHYWEDEHRLLEECYWGFCEQYFHDHINYFLDILNGISSDYERSVDAQEKANELKEQEIELKKEIVDMVKKGTIPKDHITFTV